MAPIAEGMPTDVYDWIVYGMLFVAPFVCGALFFIDAPYGRFRRAGWGPTIDARWGWLAMELPAVLVVAYFFVGAEVWTAVTVLLFLAWQAHYVHRALIYPFTLVPGRSMPVTVMLMAIVFNALNGTVNGINLAVNGDRYATAAWMLSPQFLVGACCFVVGAAINKSADSELRSLRKGNPTGYGMPRRSMHRYVSCANYFGELLQWTGWAIATWSLAGLSFAVWTFANLFPRALSTHRWYEATFPDYPKRKAIIPFVV